MIRLFRRNCCFAVFLIVPVPDAILGVNSTVVVERMMGLEGPLQYKLCVSVRRSIFGEFWLRAVYKEPFFQEEPLLLSFKGERKSSLLDP